VPLPVRPGNDRAVTVIDVIRVGGAPASVYDDLLAILAPGAAGHPPDKAGQTR